ncbi:MAG: hypothetical protein WDO56_34120 [Gammaproteobacteria bacterium]
MARSTIRSLAGAPALALVSAMALLSGCGLGETAATTAAMAEAKAQEIKAAKETQAKIEKRLDDAQAAAAQQRADAEKLTE